MAERTRDALLSGLLGACALTLVHETARRVVPHAPRVDVLGERALQQLWQAAGRPAPPRGSLYLPALAEDLASNTLLYALVGRGGRRGALRRGAALGLLAGTSALVLPRLLELGPQPGQRTPQTQAMTLLWYTLGGVVAGAVYRRIGERK